MSPRRKQLLAVALSSLVALALLDIALRLAPELPGERLANAVWSRYGGFAGGIYVKNKDVGIQFMRPNFTTENYWNGYRWRHSTDERGFRNAQGTAHDVLLLGDSLIYGHGVEEEMTVAHFLRSEHSIAAYNMGRQGACLLDEYIYLRTFVDELAPTDVVLFPFINDFHDLEVYRTADEIERIPELTYDYAAVRAWMDRQAHRPPRPIKRWISTRPSYRLLRALAKDFVSQLSLATPAWAAEGPDPQSLPDFLTPFGAAGQLAPIARYYGRIFADLAPRLAARGIRLHVVYLSAGADRAHWQAEQRAALALLDQATRPWRLQVRDTTELFENCNDCFLPRDGHLTEKGHRRLADFLAQELRALPEADLTQANPQVDQTPSSPAKG